MASVDPYTESPSDLAIRLASHLLVGFAFGWFVRKLFPRGGMAVQAVATIAAGAVHDRMDAPLARALARLPGYSRATP